ncbi:WcbI family polysaccharide biosynthesis putative acetyltransferase [Methylobacterium sp. J-090]|uniref:WcbI family polysaccharide biosynthesis putative acetyltransferase n=1 Tax=Methylobacterium sp. J-090 TaxID=2836666 RepID=UPI001FBB30ED|nr:WcbI family polysaccharide biosynthesis putative acetyltransferase [Methylobacterium sp. J-090]MCJ2083255.1 WcbI family polysaccharide biosynthesis putative acetyltransferase [Methylobacterium sp. J-090]
MLGNCQADGIARVLSLLLPDARVTLVPLAGLGRDHATLARLRDHLTPFDHVFSQFFPEGFVAGGNVHALARNDPRIRLYPTILFPAFHPDMVHVGDVGALSATRLVHSPMGPYHSAIALCAYLEGRTVNETLALFRDDVFAHLGYYDAWSEASAYLLGSARDIAFPLDAELARWARRGCFMHVLNHPKVFVLADLARRLAREAGLAPLDLAAEDYLADDLVADAVWPLYPEIARRYGLAGTTHFKPKERGGASTILLDRKAFVAGSFAAYARHPMEALVCPRVAAWRGAPAVRAMFS